jgi:dUTP pyrophosphatase
VPELRVAVERLPSASDLPLPAYASPGAAGLDLLAAVREAVVLDPLARALIPAGIRLALPEGYEAQVRPRSGLALRQGVTVLNAPGTIDADYRGEVGVILINLGTVSFAVERGTRIAQLVVAPATRVAWVERRLDAGGTARGGSGFGATG